MALLTYQGLKHITANGGGIVMSTPTASDTIPWDDRGFLYYENANAGAITVTIPAPAGLDFGTGTMPDMTYTLAATTGRQWIPMSPQLADPITGLVTVNTSPTASVTRAAVRR